MRLICPNCATQYDVADSDIPAAGRVVQCGICENEWTAHRPLKLTSPAVDAAPVAAEIVEARAAIDGFPETAPPAEVSNAIADALGSQYEPATAAPDDFATDATDTPEEDPAARMQADIPPYPETAEHDADTYATDDDLSIDAEDDRPQAEENQNVSDFDAEALRALLARPVGAQNVSARAEVVTAPDRPDIDPTERQTEVEVETPSEPDTIVEDDAALIANVMDAAEDSPAVMPQIGDAPDTGESPDSRITPRDEIGSTTDGENRPDEDFSIPPVPQDDTIRAGADAAFEAMRARRAERRAQRLSKGEDVPASPLVERPAQARATDAEGTPSQDSDAVLNDLRRLLDSPDAARTAGEADADIVSPDAGEPAGGGTPIEPPTQQTVVEMPAAPRRERPGRPGRPGRPDAAAAATPIAAARPTPAAADSGVATAGVDQDAGIKVGSPPVKQASGGSFGLGFATSVFVAALLLAIYVFAGDLSTALPPAAPALDNYVAAVDGIRVAIAQAVRG